VKPNLPVEDVPKNEAKGIVGIMLFANEIVSGKWNINDIACHVCPC
jgi:hypothetical protein